MRILRALGAGLAVAVLLFGVPAALLVWAHPEVLWQVDWATALLRPDDGSLFLGLLAVVAWVAWLVVAVTIVAEIVSALTRGAVGIRLPGTGWLRPAVGALVAAALTPVLTAAVPPGLAPPPLAAVLDVRALADEPPAAVDEAEPQAASSSTVPYVVQPGDELWSLAEQFLGSGERWPEIVAANDGLSHERRLVAGERLAMPVDAETAEAAGRARAAEPAPEVITVARGDTLWDLAARHLGEPERWTEIYEANRDRITDPDRIDVGWQLAIPAAEVVQTAEAEPVDEAVQVEGTVRLDEVPPAVIETAPAPDLPQPVPVETPGPAGQGAAESPDNAPAGVHRVGLGSIDSPARQLLGPLGAVLAAGIFAGVAIRRRRQSTQRRIGRRLSPLDTEQQRYWTSLGRAGAEACPDVDEPLPPTGVVLGWAGDTALPHDLEEARATWITSPEPELAGSMVAAVLTSLVCAEWSSAVELVVVEPDDDWAGALDDPRVRCVASLEEALSELQVLCARRRIELGSSDLASLRSDADLADAWSPVVFVCCRQLTGEAVERVRRQLDLGRVGVSVVGTLTQGTTPPHPSACVRIHSAEDAVRLNDGAAFAPQLLPAPTRRAVVGLFRASATSDTEPAPWWDHTPLPPNVKVLPSTSPEPSKDPEMSPWPGTPSQPTLLLLGSIELLGCRGQAPTRSVTAALECCAWLLDHPGATPSRMLRDLVVAETTRRSNLSRLRAWLGQDPDGEPYLPDGYSGQLELHPDVTSDWERFQLLLGGGVNQASTAVLRQALGLVRGAPLEGVDFQWPWADQLRLDMIGMIADAGAVLCDRSLELGDVATARWAIEQAKLAATDDELIGVRDIQLLAMEGDTAGLDQAVRRVTRAARAAGRDLAPDSVQRIQQALHLSVAGLTAT